MPVIPFGLLHWIFAFVSLLTPHASPALFQFPALHFAVVHLRWVSTIYLRTAFHTFCTRTFLHTLLRFVAILLPFRSGCCSLLAFTTRSHTYRYTPPLPVDAIPVYTLPHHTLRLVLPHVATPRGYNVRCYACYIYVPLRLHSTHHTLFPHVDYIPYTCLRWVISPLFDPVIVGLHLLHWAVSATVVDCSAPRLQFPLC